jgi:outer membrane protein assembly factor BamD (BamD/ComL family)
MQARSKQFDNMRKVTTAVLLIAAILVISMVSFSCATTPPTISDDMSPGEIIQKAQEKTDAYDWKSARLYYNALLERYPNDPALVVTAMYELAFIEYKQGHKAQAIEGFKAVIAKYEAPGGELLPPRWKILAEKLLASLTPQVTP